MKNSRNNYSALENSDNIIGKSHATSTSAHELITNNYGQSRLLTKAQAAHYCALSPRGFAAWVKSGRLPGPITGTTRWDRRAIDVALDDAMTMAANENIDPYDTWKARYHENQSNRDSHSKKKTR